MSLLASQTSPIGLPLRGATRPRVETHPDYAYSFGDESAELMRRARRPLDGWQVDSVTLMLACRDDDQYACFEYCEWVSRQNGKGGVLEARALTGFLLLGEQLILWSAHLYKTAVEMFRRVKALIRALGTKVKPHSDDLWYVPAVVIDEETGEPREDIVIVKVSNANDNRGFERLDTGARILFIARSAGGGRGMSGDVNIIDETFDYDREEHSALLYTLSARPNAQIIYTSSPPLKGNSGEIMYELRRRGDPTAPRPDDAPPWEQDDSLGYRDWGHAGDLDDIQVDIDDMNVAAAVNPALNIRITEKKVRGELKSDRAGYPRERLGIWPREITAALSRWRVIPKTDWADAFDPDSQMGKKIALAVSVSWDRTRASICAAGPRADGLLHGETVENKAGTGWVVKRLKELVGKWSPVAVVVNPGGPAGSLIPEIEAEGITVKQPTSRETAQAYGAFYDAVCGKPYLEQDADGNNVLVDPRKFRHVGDEELTDAVAVGQTRPLGGGHAWDLKDADGDLTPVDGVTLALLGVAAPEEEPANPPATAPSAQPSGRDSNMFRPTSRLSI